MGAFNGKAFGLEMVALVKDHLARAVSPLTDRLSALERRLDALPTAKDGVGVAGAMIDRVGNLVLTLTDGTTRELGLVVGKDAEPARDGADGFGFEDMEEELADDGRTIVRRYRRGDEVKEFRHSMAVVLDRGVYKAGQEYEPGDAVTFGGSLWIAQAKTTEKPEGGDAWRLAVKKGRDGKDIAR